MKHKVISYGKTDVGLIRKNNEDAFAASMETGFCALADGMGGAAAGEVASHFFVETVMEVFSDSHDTTDDERIALVQKSFNLANQKILSHVKVNPDHEGMGCTAELLAFTYDGFVLGHIGDSRSYRLRNGQLKQLTKDHSLVQDQLDQGLITKEQAEKHLQRNIILRALGITEDLSLDIIRGKILENDLFLLCSDGLTDMVRDNLIQKVLSEHGSDLSHMADELIKLAKEGGGKDNVTVVLARVE